MDYDSKIQSLVRWGLGALGLSAIVSAVAIPHIGIWVALFILLLALLLFGGYYLLQRRRARRQREQFTSAIEEQTSAAPRTISDPKKRADLDKVRGKFQTGLQEFKSRGKDIYQLPWYVIIGESGSGKSEAIRHSEIDFPPGLNKEHQGTGGTVNMDWWFSNRGVILDTAGSMLFPEAGAGDAPEWTEFLRLLKKARPQCPVNGLFLVLSIESLIKDSADKISQKASRLAQHLDLIQRTLDVRFPVYLLVTKCDLLTGFREFFDSIEDPLLQHQIFGWSNPDPLDAPFRPDLIEQHLGSVAERVSRRRLALLRETSPAGRMGGDTQQFFASSRQSGGGAGTRRLDEVDSMFALPESIMRLAPRLRRYLETIFVAGEWSAKPVFLRGIYFTSSMREGKALDEAIAFATGLPLDQLPEDRTWDKNRAFFLRDLFHEKVFRESGLVTRATNTLKLLRQRQLVIFGTAGAALLLVLVFAFFSYRGLQKSVLKEAAYWQAGATNWNQGEWSNSIVRAGAPPNVLHFSYAGTNVVEAGSARPTLTEYHQWLRKIAEKPLPVGLVFKPLEWLHIGSVHDRPAGQRLLFEGSVLKPLVSRTREKMSDPASAPAGSKALELHRNALLSLMRLEADGLLANPSGITSTNEAQRYLKSFVSYLTDMDWTPDSNLVDVFAWTYAKDSLGNNNGKWPPDNLRGGNTLAANNPIRIGLEKFHKASLQAQTNIDLQLTMLNELADKLNAYHQGEREWLNSDLAGACSTLSQRMVPLKAEVDASWSRLQTATNAGSGPLTSLSATYFILQTNAANASVSALAAPVSAIVAPLPDSRKTTGLFKEIQDKMGSLALEAAGSARSSYDSRRAWLAALDTNCIARAPGSSMPAYEWRWSLYTGACALASSPGKAVESDIGNEWKRFGELKVLADQFRTSLASYKGPLSDSVSNNCNRIAADAEHRLKDEFIDSYVKLVTERLSSLPQQYSWNLEALTNARALFASVKRDLAGSGLGPQEKERLASLGGRLAESKQKVLGAIDSDIRRKLGFPVLLDAGNTMNAGSMLAVKKQLDQIDSELSNPVWADFPDGAKAVDSLKGKTESYRSVARALVMDDKGADSIAKLKLSFVPHGMKDDSGSDFDFTKVYRWLKVSFDSQQIEEKEITTQPGQEIALGEGKLDRAMTFSFRDNLQATKVVTKQVKEWALARLIHDGEAKSDDGQTWRIRFTLPSAPIESKGVVFEMKLDKPLPRKDDWPK